MNEEMKFCQSCGMPMQAAGDFGTETDGSPSGEYCVYCYKGGTFTGQGFDDYMKIFAIPSSELASNPELHQNPGYGNATDK
ncbi:transcriptional regulator [Proteus mirabilis]|jgi:hypothetical protein|nr:transcriptional regulator [Proteus mirabilis]